MISLAILHATLPSYMAQGQLSEAKHFDVQLASSNLTQFRLDLNACQPRVLVLDLALLGDDPVAAVEELERRSSPELVLIVYPFARWEVVEGLRGPKRQVLRAPISVRMLHANLVGLIVREMTQRRAEAPQPAETPLLSREPAKRRYSDLQLSALQEIKSAVDCECPNQVADLVLALVAFEQYSHACKNRNAEDAKVHAMLARVTGHARSMMEAGLAELCRFEQIDVDRLTQRRAS